MFKLLFKYVIPLAVFLTIGIVGYNYFFGTPEEQESSKQIISKVKGLGADIYDLLSSEADKFEDGKYDEAIDKIAASLSYLKDQMATMADEGGQFLEQLRELEAEKKQLELELVMLKESQRAAEASTDSAGQSRSRAAPNRSAAKIQQHINQLAKKTEQLAMKMQGGR